jgi:hypothetical protein
MRLSQPAKIAVGCGVGGGVLAGAAVFVIYWFNRRAQVAARRDEGSTWGDVDCDVDKEALLRGAPLRTVDSLQAVEQSERLAQAKAQQPLGHSSSAAEAPLRDPFGNGYSTGGPLEWPREAYAALAAGPTAAPWSPTWSPPAGSPSEVSFEQRLDAVASPPGTRSDARGRILTL